jgi:uncharacterized protein YcsI (UPF0317 family)
VSQPSCRWGGADGVVVPPVAARPPCSIMHAPGCMLVTDLVNTGPRTA